MFAIPNRDGSFNAVIVLPALGEDSFAPFYGQGMNAGLEHAAERFQGLARLAGLDLVVGMLALRHTISGWLRRGRAGAGERPSERNAVAAPRTSP